MNYLDKMKRHLDSIAFGILCGIFAPLLTGFIFGYVYISNWLEFFEMNDLVLLRGLYGTILQLGVISNLVVFFIFYRIRYDASAKGVIAATFLYAFTIIILNFLT